MGEWLRILRRPTLRTVPDHPVKETFSTALPHRRTRAAQRRQAAAEESTTTPDATWPEAGPGPGLGDSQISEHVSSGTPKSLTIKGPDMLRGRSPPEVPGEIADR